MLRWIELERRRAEGKNWFITLDTSLPAFRLDPDIEGAAPLAMTLIAFLQWIAPIAVQEDAEEGMATIFSEAV